MGEFVAGSILQTARIPELQPLTVDVPLDLADQLPVYISSENKTKKVPLSVLNTFFNLGGSTSSHPPAVWGGEYIYIVPLAAAGTDTAPIPALAGKDFTLERGGLPLVALLPDESNDDVAEYEILDSGGFKLLIDDDVLNEGERFKLQVFSLIATTPGPSVPTTNAFIAGKKQVTVNTTLDAAQDANKVIQVRAAGVAVTVTVPSVGDLPVNSFLIIETLVNNTKPTKILTTGGQSIYMNNGSRTSLDMHPGEVLWLYRDNDGWYVFNDFHKHYRELCKPLASYEVQFDEVLCKGQELNRADYPRIWEKANTLGSSIVTDATWNLAQVYAKDGFFFTTPPAPPYRTVLRPYRGCFSQGNGTTTFRMPDLMNMHLRGVLSETGSDPERYHNKPGGYQDSVFKKFWAGVVSRLVMLKIDGNGTESAHDTDPGFVQPNLMTGTEIDQTVVGAETRGEGVGVFYVMKK